MAKFGPLKNATIIVGGVDLSNHCESVTVQEGAETGAFHAMSDETAYLTPTLFTWSVSATFFQDFAAANVDATIRALMAARTVFPLLVRPDSAAISATNPAWSGSAFISSYSPIQGAHGAVAMAAVTFSPAGNLSRIIA